MLAFFRALVDRLKALLLTDATLDLQAHVATKAAERKAELLRRAAAYEKGLSAILAVFSSTSVHMRKIGKEESPPVTCF